MTKFWEEPTLSSEGELWKLGYPQGEIQKFPLQPRGSLDSLHTRQASYCSDQVLYKWSILQPTSQVEKWAW